MNFFRATGSVALLNRTDQLEPKLSEWFKTNVSEEDVGGSMARVQGIQMHTERHQTFPATGRNLNEIVQSFLKASNAIPATAEMNYMIQDFSSEVARAFRQVELNKGTAQHIFMFHSPADTQQIALFEFTVGDSGSWTDWWTGKKSVGMHSYVFSFLPLEIVSYP